MLEQAITLEAATYTEESDTELTGPGACKRCQSEGSPHPCYSFAGSGTTCQRNWCAHNWADHA